MDKGEIMAEEKKYTGYGYHGGGRPAMAPADRKVFKTVSISGSPEEIEKLKEMANTKNVSVSRYVLRKCLWHDLLQNPNDLPNSPNQVLIMYEGGDYDIGEYWNGEGWGKLPDKVIKWKNI